MNGYVRTSEAISDAMPVQRVRALDKNEGSPSMAAEASEPIRRSTMRLAFPRIKSLQSDDGAASIIFQSIYIDREEGGYTYLFVFKTPSGDTEVHVTVDCVTGTPAANKFKAETGNVLWSLSMADIQQYIDKYADEHGNLFLVRSFKVPSVVSDDSIVILRDAFCELFFKCWSSYKYNNADEASDPSDFYPDTIEFMPADLNKKFHVTVHAKRGERHD